MRTAIALITLAFCTQSYAGQGSGGGLAAAVREDAAFTLNRTEFNNVAIEAISKKDFMINGSVMRPQSIDLQNRSIIMKSTIDPSKIVIIREAEEGAE